MSEQTLNIPQLIAVLLITFFALRWYFSSPSSTSSSSSARSSRHDRVNPAHVEQLAQMFPQLERREIAWDLQRNGGHMAMTTERALSGRELESPPQSFQPPPSVLDPNATSTFTSSSSSSTTSSSSSSTNPTYQNLIARYNLSSKLSSSRGIAASSSTTEQAQDGSGSAKGSASPAGKTWSSNKTERQRLLQERREQMILEARRRMLEKERGS